MKASNVKKNIKESIFDVWFDAFNKTIDKKLNDKSVRAAPQIIRDVAFAGFEDFNKRLLAAGINLKNLASVRDPATQQLIKENLIKYVEQYMAGGESQEYSALILKELQNRSKLPLPTQFDQNSIFKYFETAAKIRAVKLNELDNTLEYTRDNFELKKLQELQAQLDANKDIKFTASIRGVSTNIVIRKDKLYSDKDITPPPTPGTTSSAPAKRVKLQPYGNYYEVTDPINFTEVYKAWVAAGSPTSSTFDESDKIKQLQDELEDNEEIEFTFSATPPVQVVIRKDAVYVSDYTGTSSSSLPPKVAVPPHGDMYEVKRPQNLTAIYQAYSRLPSPPAPVEFAAPTLE